jgi:hypothetical protein
MRTLTLALAALLLSPLAVSQEIYRWVDKNGVVHYSDQPSAPDAELMDLQAFGGQAEEPRAPATYVRETPPAEPAPGYRSLTITRPAMDEAFFGTDATVAVELELDAELRAGHELAIYLDGRRVPSNGLSAELPGVTRGTHFLRAAVLDASGNVLISSPQVAFHVRQASIATPPTGPAQRPQPQPRPQPRQN